MIQDRVIDEARLMYDSSASEYELESVPDIRSLVDPNLPELPSEFLCEEKECLVERAAVLQMAGVDDIACDLHIFVADQVNEVAAMNKQIKSITAQIEGQVIILSDRKTQELQSHVQKIKEKVQIKKKGITALLKELGYTKISWRSIWSLNGCVTAWMDRHGGASEEFMWGGTYCGVNASEYVDEN